LRQTEIAAWAQSTPNEQALWEETRRTYETAVPAEDIRLAVPAELTDLAARCELKDVALTEVSAEELATAWLDLNDGRRDLGFESQGDSWGQEGMGWPADARLADVLRLEQSGFQMEFVAPYGALMRFWRGLERTRTMVVVRRVSIRRGVPDLRVEMVIAAYRRQGEV
jgi:hypothetical protein